MNKRLIFLLIMNDQYQNSYKQVLTHIACIGRYVYLSQRYAQVLWSICNFSFFSVILMFPVTWTLMRYTEKIRYST